mgnify:FL=1
MTINKQWEDETLSPSGILANFSAKAAQKRTTLRVSVLSSIVYFIVLSVTKYNPGSVSVTGLTEDNSSANNWLLAVAS